MRLKKCPSTLVDPEGVGGIRPIRIQKKKLILRRTGKFLGGKRSLAAPLRQIGLKILQTPPRVLDLPLSEVRREELIFFVPSLPTSSIRTTKL